MVFGKLVRYGVPLSFVYCTIYQQDIWREGDERLISEQKHTWRKFFNLIDTIVTNSQKVDVNDSGSLNLTSTFDSLDIKTCWNAKVMGAYHKMNDAPKLLTQWAKSAGL